MFRLYENRNEKQSSNEVTLDEAKSSFQALYPRTNDMTKIKLKCWLYYCESRAKGGKDALPFDSYSNMVGQSQYIEMVRGNLVDVSDLGGIDRAVEIICRWFK